METIIIAEEKMTNNCQCKAARQKQNKRCNCLFMCSIYSAGVIGSLCVLYIVQLIGCLFVLYIYSTAVIGCFCYIYIYIYIYMYHWLFMCSIYSTGIIGCLCVLYIVQVSLVFYVFYI